VSTIITNSPNSDQDAVSAGGSWVTDEKKAPSRLRGASRRRSIPHLLLGVLLVLACAIAFLLIALRSDDRQPVLALARPVSVGQVLKAQDLRQVNISADPDLSVVDAERAASVVGQTMSISLPPGALLTPTAVGSASVPAAGQALAALALKAGQFPPEAAPGAHVAVVFIPGQAGAASSVSEGEATRAWPGVVTSVSAPANTQTTVVSVQLVEAAAREVAAVPTGQLSIVMLSDGDR
jgi:hypothetical protein